MLFTYLYFNYSLFEAAQFDINERLTTDIPSCFDTEKDGDKTKYIAKNSSAKICVALTEKKKIHCFVNLCSPLQSLNTLLPAGLDFGVRLQFAEGTNLQNKYLKINNKQARDITQSTQK